MPCPASRWRSTPNCPPALIDEKTARAPPARAGGGKRLLRRHGRRGEIRPRRRHRRPDHHRASTSSAAWRSAWCATAWPFADAAATFTTLTVGDGLVSQIPALLVSTAAGIVVTKGGIEGTADAALMRQLGGNPKPLALAGRRRRGAGADAGPADAAVPGAGRAGRRRRLAAPPAPAGRGRRRAAAAARRCRPSRRSAEALRMDMIRLELGLRAARPGRRRARRG